MANRNIRLTVVVKRKHLKSLEFRLEGVLGSFTKSHRPAFVELLKPQTKSVRLAGSKIPAIRNLLIGLSRYPAVILPFRWNVVNITFDIPSQSRVALFSCSKGGIEISTLIFRRAALIGLYTTELDLSLDYSFRRNFQDYSAFVTDSTEDRIGSSNHRNNSFFAEQMVPDPEVNPALSLAGVEAGPQVWKNLAGHPIWSYTVLENASVLHGQVVLKDDYFFFTDSTRAPRKPNSEIWPASVQLFADLKLRTPKVRDYFKSISEGIFVGGTNNLMHFVLEDLPRLILADKINLDPHIPLIFRSGLSEQILATIRVVTKRDFICLPVYSGIKVQKLHLLRLENQLVSTMAGDETAADKLIDRDLLNTARALIYNSIEIPVTDAIGERILIVRERNLFRPLVNSSKLARMLTKKFNFSAVSLKDKSLTEILEIFSYCKIVVSEYGAGLANIIYTRNNPLVLEIRGPMEKNAIEYEALTLACGLEHKLLVGRQRLISRFGIGRGPFHVSVNKLVKLLGA